MAETYVWEGLSLYESTDLVARLYKEHHGSEPKAEKANEIVSQLAQGREYFSSASNSAEIVRPLLVYYGVLSLSRGLILFLERGLRETHLAHGHGLEPSHWSQQLSVGIRELPNLQVTFRKGTFTELSKATKNTERSTVMRGENYADGVFSPYVYEQEGTEEVPIGTFVTFKDILSRIPDLDEIYEYTFNLYSDCYPTELFIHTLSNHTDVALVENRGERLDEEGIRYSLGISEDISLNHKTSTPSMWLYDEPHWLFSVPHTSVRELSQQLPVVRADNGGGHFFVPSLADGLRLSSLSLLFVASYVMGMLVRYYPSQWLAALGRSRGDFSLPLLKAAMSVVEQRFPELVLREFELRSTTANRRRIASKSYS